MSRHGATPARAGQLVAHAQRLVVRRFSPRLSALGRVGVGLFGGLFEQSRARWSMRRLLEGLCFFTGLTASWGGVELSVWPRGGAPGFTVPLSVLARTPFRDFSGSALTVWIVTELAMLRSPHWLHGLYLAVGLGTMATALWLWKKTGERYSPEPSVTG